MTEFSIEDLDALLQGATPGRWFQADDDGWFYAQQSENKDDDLCVLTPEDFVSVSDAALIAAAPVLASQLREALKREQRLREALGGIAFAGRQLNAVEFANVAIDTARAALEGEPT